MKVYACSRCNRLYEDKLGEKIFSGSFEETERIESCKRCEKKPRVVSKKGEREQRSE